MINLYSSVPGNILTNDKLQSKFSKVRWVLDNHWVLIPSQDEIEKLEELEELGVTYKIPATFSRIKTVDEETCKELVKYFDGFYIGNVVYTNTSTRLLNCCLLGKSFNQFEHLKEKIIAIM